MHDLKIRGGGNILGFVQSGQISAIGYELYMKLIERATAELKGEEWYEDMDPEINADITAFLPAEYVIDTDVRLNLYRRLSGLREKVELKAMKEEIEDRFGPPPREVSNLLGLMSIRLLLKKMRISRLDVGKNSLFLTFALDRPVNAEGLLRYIKEKPHRFQFMAQNKLKVHMGPDFSPHDYAQIEHAIAVLDEKGYFRSKERISKLFKVPDG
jgi:transcription-repair coupling factor (superfamily II helicase)